MKHFTQQDWLNTRPWIDLEDADLRAYMAHISDTVGFDLEKKLNDWIEQGIVIFEGVVDHSLVTAMLSDIEYLRTHYRDFDLFVEIRGHQTNIKDVTEEDLNSYGFKFNSIHTLSNAAGLLSLTNEVMVFLSHVFGSAPCLLQSLTFYHGSQQPAHIDYPYVRCQTKLAHLAASWIPLENIHADSGPLAYYPGSHKTEVSGFFDWGNGSILLEPDSHEEPMQFSSYLYERIKLHNLQPLVFLPKLGDVLIWHGNLIHEGTQIHDLSLTRKSHVSHYTSYEGYPVAHRRSDKSGISVNGGYAYEYPWLSEKRKHLPSVNAISK